jgi:hypothetical protein
MESSFSGAFFIPSPVAGVKNAPGKELHRDPIPLRCAFAFPCPRLPEKVKSSLANSMTGPPGMEFAESYMFRSENGRRSTGSGSDSGSYRERGHGNANANGKIGSRVRIGDVARGSERNPGLRQIHPSLIRDALSVEPAIHSLAITATRTMTATGRCEVRGGLRRLAPLVSQ